MVLMSAFNSLAPTYDVDFTESPIARYLRRRVHERLLNHFHMGDTVLELGCGTGEDALLLGTQGINVIATDSSFAMLDIACTKTAHLPNVSITRLDLNDLTAENTEYPDFSSSFSEASVVNGVFSNFGALNCLDRWDRLAAWLANHVKSGGIAAFGIMSPYCLWEMIWHGLHRDFRVTFRRLRREAEFQSGGKSLSIHYPTIRRLKRDFAPYFKLIHVEPLGFFLPPSDVYPIIEERPRLQKILMSGERNVAQLAFLAPFADHYWIEFERTSVKIT
jgi:SAM-dependent methyltransferase